MEVCLPCFFCLRIAKGCQNESNGDGLSTLLGAVNAIVPTCIKMFSHEDDDVSAQCIDFLRDYVDLLKKTFG